MGKVKLNKEEKLFLKRYLVEKDIYDRILSELNIEDLRLIYLRLLSDFSPMTYPDLTKIMSPLISEYSCSAKHADYRKKNLELIKKVNEQAKLETEIDKNKIKQDCRDGNVYMLEQKLNAYAFNPAMQAFYSFVLNIEAARKLGLLKKRVLEHRLKNKYSRKYCELVPGIDTEEDFESLANKISSYYLEIDYKIQDEIKSFKIEACSIKTFKPAVGLTKNELNFLSWYKVDHKSKYLKKNLIFELRLSNRDKRILELIFKCRLFALEIKKSYKAIADEVGVTAQTVKNIWDLFCRIINFRNNQEGE